MNKQERVSQLHKQWKESDRWSNIKRPYTPDQVLKLTGSVKIDHTLARLGAARLWDLLHDEDCVTALGALTGNQAVQQVQAGLKAIYLSGWQVAADANASGQTYPDLSLYPADSVPAVVRRINNALLRADQIQGQSGDGNIHWMAPIVADAEAGFGGNLNTFELMKMMIEAGAAGVHFEDQLSSAKKCGHLGGKVLVPTREAVDKLIAARLAADVMDVPTLIIARTDADAATLLTSDVDERDRPFIQGPRTHEGFYRVKNGIDQAISRGLSYAPYADLVWCETSHPSLEEAHDFALGYKFQFVTLAGFHALNTSMFELAIAYRERGMAGYSELQQTEFALQQEYGFKAVKHQAFVGTGYFDAIQEIITNGQTSTIALKNSTEEAQFGKATEVIEVAVV
jgi:isocitrate lyase